MAGSVKISAKRLLLALAAVSAMATSALAQDAQPVQPAQAPDVVALDTAKSGVFVRDAPSLDGVVVEALTRGETLKLRQAGAGWNAVDLPDGRTGFVSQAWTRVLAPPLQPGQFRVHVVDVGTGLGVFVEGADFTLVYDAGSNDDKALGRANRFLAYLRYARPDLRRIDQIVLSHPHQDHVLMLADLFEAYQVGDVWDSGRPYKSCVYQTFLTAVGKAANVTYHQVEGTAGRLVKTANGCQTPATVTLNAGAPITASPVGLGAQAQMTILYRDATPYPDPNENSLVTRLDLGGAKLLLMGDAEAGTGRADPTSPPDQGSNEARLLDCCRADLRADVLFAGHHGSKTSSRSAFVDAVGAKTYIISSGPMSYGGTSLPDRVIEDQFRARGTLFETNIDDAACARSRAKIGPDADGRPGGCDNIIITIDRGQLSTAYAKVAD